MAVDGSPLTESRWLRGREVDARDLHTLRDWFPVALGADDIWWRHLPGRFTTPFFADALRAQPAAERLVCRTPLEWLDRIEAFVPPGALVFHSSRCGSTLLAQMLATLPQCIVQSEPPVIDDFLARHGDGPVTSALCSRLRGLLHALGQRRAPQESHFVVKLDCWHIRHLPLLRAALPGTPFWFLYRDPDAIMHSHRRQRGPQMVPGMVLPAGFGEGLAPGDLEGYCARVIGDILERALAHRDELLLLDYRQLPDVVWEDLVPRLGVACTGEQLAAMRERSRFHAKSGNLGYAGDPAAAQATPPHLVSALAPLYARLEAARLGLADR